MNKLTKPFKNTGELLALVNDYFDRLSAEFEDETNPAKKAIDSASKKATAREAEPATIAGLVLHLGLNSREEFDKLEKKGRYSAVLKRARLRVEAAYEKKLHQSSPTGAIFVLKSMGWNEKTEAEKTPASINGKIEIKVITTGPTPASTEKEITL